MSNRLIEVCRPLRAPPVPKNVLLAIADRTNDQSGIAWQSVSDICETTCYGKTSVIEAVHWLEVQGFLTIERRQGRSNSMVIDIDAVLSAIANQVTNPSATRSGSRGGPPREPVRHADTTPPPRGHHPSATRTPPVRHADPNHKEPSLNHLEPEDARARRKPAALSASVLLPEVTDQVLADWLSVRKAKRAGPVTETVVKGLRNQAAAAGLSLQEVLELCCARGWQGFNAEWVRPGGDRASATVVPGLDAWQDSKTGITRRGAELGMAWAEDGWVNGQHYSFPAYAEAVKSAHSAVQSQHKPAVPTSFRERDEERFRTRALALGGRALAESARSTTTSGGASDAQPDVIDVDGRPVP